MLQADPPSSAWFHFLHTCISDHVYSLRHKADSFCFWISFISLNLKSPAKDATLIRVPEPKKEICDRERLEGVKKQGTRGSVREWQLMTVATSCDL